MATCATCPAKVRHTKYCAACSPLKDRAWRQARGRKAGAAAVVHHRQRMARTFAKLTPVEAGVHGYRMGYKRAYVYWHQWAERRVAQITGRRGKAA